MGLQDAEEMLEIAKADAVQLEHEISKLRAVIARVADYCGTTVDQEANNVRIGERVSEGRTDVAQAVLALVDEAAASAADLAPLSTIYRNGVPQTWQQVALDLEERVRTGDAALALLSDLDRNRNGRHYGDADTSPDGGVFEGVSTGNPLLLPGEHIGYGLGGTRLIVIPVDADERRNPLKWYVPRSRAVQ